MRYIANSVFLSVFLLMTYPAIAGMLPKKLRHAHTIKSDGIERIYRINVPDSYSAKKAVPLVFIFHGGGGNSASLARHTEFSALSEQEGFIAVFPEGLHRKWNMGGPFDWGKQEPDKPDDIVFIKTLLENLKKQYVIDERHIFATGMSMGGMMSYALGCKLSEDFAAIAPVAGTMNTSVCKPSQQTALLHIHSRNDEHVPLAGGGAKRMPNKHSWPPVYDGMNLWAENNECTQKTEDLSYPASGAMCQNLKGCKKTVEFCLVDGGHHWPGGGTRLWQAVANVETTEFPAARYIWNFLNKNPK